MNTALLEVRHLTKCYGSQGSDGWLTNRATGKRASRPAVNDVSFSFGAGETLGIIGETGSGKSTLGQCIVGLVPPTSGTVLLDGKAFEYGQRARQQRALDVQVVFQDPYSSLNPRRSIGSVLREILRVTKLRPQDQHDARVQELLESVHLPSNVAKRSPRDLSGGQRQRVAIARALAFEPRLIVADEVVSALDAATQAQILNLLRDLQEQTGMGLIFISHDLAVVKYLCERTIVMYGGEKVESGLTERVFGTPEHPYTQKLLSAVLSV